MDDFKCKTADEVIALLKEDPRLTLVIEHTSPSLEPYSIYDAYLVRDGEIETRKFRVNAAGARKLVARGNVCLTKSLDIVVKRQVNTYKLDADQPKARINKPKELSENEAVNPELATLEQAEMEAAQAYIVAEARRMQNKDAAPERLSELAAEVKKAESVLINAKAALRSAKAAIKT